MPRMIESAYPRIGTGPRCQTPWSGLGMLRLVRRGTRTSGVTAIVTEESITHSSSSWCTSEANWVALVPCVQRIGTSSPPSMASTDVPCVTSYPPLGS